MLPVERVCVDCVGDSTVLVLAYTLRNVPARPQPRQSTPSPPISDAWRHPLTSTQHIALFTCVLALIGLNPSGHLSRERTYVHGHAQGDLLADLIVEVAAGVPANVLIAPRSAPIVERLCNGEDVRSDVTAWTEVLRGAPVVAELVLRLAELE